MLDGHKTIFEVWSRKKGDRGIQKSENQDHIDPVNKKFKKVDIKSKDGKIYMHQTLTQVLMTPSDLQPIMKQPYPPKPLLLRTGS